MLPRKGTPGISHIIGNLSCAVPQLQCYIHAFPDIHFVFNNPYTIRNTYLRTTLCPVTVSFLCNVYISYHNGKNYVMYLLYAVSASGSVLCFIEQLYLHPVKCSLLHSQKYRACILILQVNVILFGEYYMRIHKRESMCVSCLIAVFT